MPIAPPESARTILVVEDEALLRMMAVDMFEDAGFAVFEAIDGEQGAKMLAENSAIDGLFTDVEMPGPINGIALAGMARELHPSLKILVVSGRASPAVADLPPGAQFVGKPYDAQIVLGLFAGLMPVAGLTPPWGEHPSPAVR